MNEPTGKREGPYLITIFECPECGHEWPGMGHFSTVGLTCPNCGNSDPEFNWLENAMKAKENGNFEDTRQSN